MKQTKPSSAYPLSPSMTRRVVNYLNGFRLFLALALLAAWRWELFIAAPTFAGSPYPLAALTLYFAGALVLLLEARRRRSEPQALAQAALLLDVLVLALLTYLFGGLDSGLAVLLVFTSGAAAVLLPLRRALFIAALATLAIIGDSVAGGMLRNGQPDNLLLAGLYGITLFLVTSLAHALARWARDFRLIAERQMATLSRMEQINEVIIKRMRGGVLAVDRNGEIRMMNEAAWLLLGNPGASDRMLESVAPELGWALSQWRDNPRRQSQPVKLGAGRSEVLPQFVALPAGREISELVFLEDNDVVARRALELSAQTLAKLSTGIAHEIRNPLAAVNHAAELLSESEAVNEADARLVEIIRKQSRRMNGIVENILQISRREKSQPELVRLAPWLEEVTQEFAGAHPDTPFVLRTPGEDRELMVLFDRSQLHQVLWKLMENALQHLGPDNDRPRLVLRLKGEAGSGFCSVCVEDNGQGIAPEAIGGIFEPFFTTRHEGSGLGLYIARQLCEANQAELTVDSEPGRGSRFTIRMKQAAGSLAAAVDDVEARSA